MSLQGVLPFVLDFSAERPIEVEVSQAQLTDGAGLLPIRQFDEAIRLTARFGAALRDARGGGVLHSNLSMVRQRLNGILADYEDQNDHDTLRSDPAFKLVCDRLPDDIDLASQPTLSRFEPPRAGGATPSRSPTSGVCGTRCAMSFWTPSPRRPPASRSTWMPSTIPRMAGSS